MHEAACNTPHPPATPTHLGCLQLPEFPPPDRGLQPRQLGLQGVQRRWLRGQPRLSVKKGSKPLLAGRELATEPATCIRARPASDAAAYLASGFCILTHHLERVHGQGRQLVVGGVASPLQLLKPVRQGVHSLRQRGAKRGGACGWMIIVGWGKCRGPESSLYTCSTCPPSSQTHTEVPSASH